VQPADVSPLASESTVFVGGPWGRHSPPNDLYPAAGIDSGDFLLVEFDKPTNQPGGLEQQYVYDWLCCIIRVPHCLYEDYTSVSLQHSFQQTSWKEAPFTFLDLNCQGSELINVSLPVTRMCRVLLW